MAIKRYSDKEPIIFIWVAVPYMIFMNLLIFGTCVFGSWGNVSKSFLVSAVYFFIVYGLFGTVAVIIKNRYPGAGDLFKRISIMLPVFYVMNIGAIRGAFAVYDNAAWIDCPTRHHMIGWTILYACIMSTLITFINEGMANWEKWKNSLSQAEKLRNAYQRSKLLGLKGQINPHFLFNCFNTLSGLIHENPARADCFLNEMIRVHRYLLRSDDAFLVRVADEQKYADAYLNLAKARFGDAISVNVDVAESAMDRMIPPLTMQVILENIIYTNALNKKDPVFIRIWSTDQDELRVSHTIHQKIIVRDLNIQEGIDNLTTRFGLLDAEVRIESRDGYREFILPLFHHQAQSA
jgi:sensor histidine kinase YesM